MKLNMNIEYESCNQGKKIMKVYLLQIYLLINPYQDIWKTMSKIKKKGNFKYFNILSLSTGSTEFNFLWYFYFYFTQEKDKV